jgi:signal transduction histidine kinase
MKRRAEEMGGTLEINTSSAGTAVILMVPTPFRIPKTWDKKANG